MIRWCDRCGQFVLRDEQHRCPPQWLVWDADDDPEDATTHYGVDEEAAAEMWARGHEGDLGASLCGGETYVVLVRPQADSQAAPARIRVRGEAVIDYYTNRIYNEEGS